VERPAASASDPIYVAFDTETTGLSPVDDRVVELAAVSFRIAGPGAGETLCRFEQLVDPGIAIPPELTLIHGITDEMVRGRPHLEAVLPEFLRFLDEASPGRPPILVAHNSPYDAAILLVALARMRTSGIRRAAAPGCIVLDTCAIARALLPGAQNHKLGTLAAMLGITPEGAHRALADVETCRKVFLSMLGCPGVDPTPEGLARLSGSEMRLSTWEEALEAAPRLSPVLKPALAAASQLTIRYAGGTKGDGPRTITPIAMQRQGGEIFLLALCHVDRALKSFRLDRITHAAAVVAAPPPASH